MFSVSHHPINHIRIFPATTSAGVFQKMLMALIFGRGGMDRPQTKTPPQEFLCNAHTYSRTREYAGSPL